MELLNKQLTYLEIPSFSATGLYWDGISTIKGQFNYLFSNGFNITNWKAIASSLLDGDVIYVIRYVLGEEVFRYALNDSAKGNLLGIPMYEGEPILENFVVEIYNTSETDVSQPLLRVEITPIVNAALGSNHRQLKDITPTLVTLAQLEDGLTLPCAVGTANPALSRHQGNVANRLRLYTGRLVTSEMQLAPTQIVLSDGLHTGTMNLDPL